MLQPRQLSDFVWLFVYLAFSYFATTVPPAAGYGPSVVVSLELGALAFAIIVGSWQLFQWWAAPVAEVRPEELLVRRKSQRPASLDLRPRL
jgi:hypothetical protein